jgi:Uncharacterised protein family (UPF0158)
MKKPDIDYDEIQKAMEDTARDAFDYYLDVETGEVIIISEQIIARAKAVLTEEFDEDMSDYDEVEFDRDYDIPDWMEDEVELVLDIFLEKKDRYMRIPERMPENVFSAMREFAGGLENQELKKELTAILDGKGSFRRFKDALEPYPKERKQWYRFSAKKARKEIMDWLTAAGITQEKNDTDLLYGIE